MAKLNEKYELMYIIDAGISEEETEALIERFNSLIEEHGTIDEHEDMGVRKLAYEIDYKTEGHYVLTKFTSGPEFPKELSRVLGISDKILRNLITKRPE